jgi:ribosome-associated toxin RatA of RatAB toxin-antitoxin module
MTFEQSAVVRASAEEVFALTQDYARRLEWDPFLRSATLLGASQPAVGVRALCVARNGFAMETEYVSYRPPHVAAVRMTRGPWLLESFAGSWRFEEVAVGRTIVSFRYHLRTRPRWLAPLLTRLVAHFFAHDTNRRLDALRRFAEANGA